MIRGSDGFNYVDETARLLGEKVQCSYNSLLNIALESDMPLHMAVKWAERKNNFAPRSLEAEVKMGSGALE